MVVGGAVYGLWLSVKGKVLADSFVVRGAAEAEFWVGSYFSPAGAIRERLEAYIIADDVTVEDFTAEWSGITWLEASGREASPGGFAFRGRRGGEAVEWVYPRSAAVDVERELESGTEVGFAAMERRRIMAGVPAVPRDVGPADLPNEARLESDAISFTKGCYLGQEVMARLKSMGQVRRRLMRVRGAASEMPALPAPLFVGARQVGELRSAVGDEGGVVGLAMLSLLHVTLESKLAFASGGEPSLMPMDSP